MRLSVITDEISPDLEQALAVCAELGVRTVELRSVEGKNVVLHDDSTHRRLSRVIADRGFRVCAIASPFLKCPAPGDTRRFDTAAGASPGTAREQWPVLERSWQVARLYQAPLVRAFSYWRLDRPDAATEVLVEELGRAAAATAGEGLTLGLENEHECNLATGAEAAAVLARVPAATLGVIWDPGNEARLGSTPFPDGYAHVRGRVVHVHVKDLDREQRWVAPGRGTIDFTGQLRALAEDGYGGALSIETHYSAAGGDSAAATRECVQALRRLSVEAGAGLD